MNTEKASACCFNYSTSTFPEEDKSCTAATQRFVCRRGHNVAVLKGWGHHSGSHQAADVSHVSHQIGTVLSGNLLHAGVIKVAGIAACSWRGRRRRRTNRGEWDVFRFWSSGHECVRECVLTNLRWWAWGGTAGRFLAVCHSQCSQFLDSPKNRKTSHIKYEKQYKNQPQIYGIWK